VANIIIYRLGSMGDTIVALPCFHRIAESFPTANRILLTNFPVSSKAAPVESILRGSGLIERAMAYPIGSRSPVKLWRLARQIRALEPVALIYLAPARGLPSAVRDLLYFRLCGVRRIVGLPITADLQNNRIDPTTGDVERECARLARTIAALGALDLSSRHVWDLLLTAEEDEIGRRTIASFGERAFFAINMGGKDPSKDWGVERWSELLARLAKGFPEHGLLVVGAAEDSPRAQAVTEAWPNAVVNSCGCLTPRETAAALKRASFFVGHDSGPLHLAASLNIATVGLFGSLNRPKKWHPHGAMVRIIHRMDGIAHITADDVMEAVSSLAANNEAEAPAPTQPHATTRRLSEVAHGTPEQSHCGSVTRLPV
jgi:ADP-heptose:LPS heptosyltransferase